VTPRSTQSPPAETPAETAQAETPAGKAQAETPPAASLPPGPAIPRAVQGGFALAAPVWWLRRLRARYGSAFTINVPVFGKVVVLSDPVRRRGPAVHRRRVRPPGDDRGAAHAAA
jgi:hypothetical protein